MYKFSVPAGKAENILNLDEQTGVALRHQTFAVKHKRQDVGLEPPVIKRRQTSVSPRGPRNVALHPIDKRQNGTQMVPPSKTKLLRNKISPVRTRADINTSEPYGYKPRRCSYPFDLNALENLDTENAMLKNELNVKNRELNELLNRLKGTEEELYKAKTKLECMESQNGGISIAKENITKQIEKLKIVIDKNNKEIINCKQEKRELETEISVLRERIQDLTGLIKQYEKENRETQAVRNETENDFRHSQSTINNLQSDLKRMKEECKRLETEWDDYRVMVKNMLKDKDKEIKALQQGVNLTEDTKILVDQLENLKDEREMLSKAVTQMREESGRMKQQMEQLEKRHIVAERVVVALRDALRKEHAATRRAEAALEDMSKEMKAKQMESEEKITNLLAAIQGMENEMNRLLDSAGSSSVVTTVETTVSNAINVADFNAKPSYETDDKEKIEYLNNKLEQKQVEIERLIGLNIMLNMQMENIESKLQAEILQRKSPKTVVPSHDGDSVPHAPSTKLPLTSKVSRWCGMVITSHPLFGVFLVLYVVCLNIWMINIQLTSGFQDTKGSY